MKNINRVVQGDNIIWWHLIYLFLFNRGPGFWCPSSYTSLFGTLVNITIDTNYNFTVENMKNFGMPTTTFSSKASELSIIEVNWDHDKGYLTPLNQYIQYYLFVNNFKLDVFKFIQNASCFEHIKYL